MSNHFYGIRLATSLILFFILFSSCNKNDRNKNSAIIEAVSKPDTTIVSLKLKEKISVGFNVFNKYLESEYIEFKSKNNKSPTIEIKIPRFFNREIIDYGYLNRSQKKPKLENQFFLLDGKTKKIDFAYSNWKFKLDKNKVNYLDTLFNSYENKIQNLKKENLIHVYEKNLTLDYIIRNNDLQEINNYIFYNYLQKINPNSMEVDSFIKNKIKDPIASIPLKSLLFFHIKNRIDSLDFKELNKKKYSEEYLELFSLGLYNFLSFEDNKGDEKYTQAIDWLKKSDLYKEDSIYIRKKITPINNSLFKSKLKNLKLLNIEKEEKKFSDILQEKITGYYLIDLWATWCKPCIEGVESMKKMDLPKNLSVISLSIDKAKDFEEWKKTTQELEQKKSFFIIENSNNKEFLTLLELQSVPRYILIDKNMNLIDEAFLHPHEPQFLSKLKDIKNYKYW